MSAQQERTFLGHPTTLITLFLTEMWERFSFYGMRAILVLFLVAPESQGGLGMNAGEAAGIYGLYNALVYVAALPGGWLADRVLGARRAVILGGLIIALGHFAMVFKPELWVFGGLILIIAGTGLLKPSLTAIVGELYARDDPRRDAGFSIYYMGINLGAFLAPLIVGYLGQEVDWHLGFAVAGVGMVIGLAQFVVGSRALGEVGAAPQVRIGDAERRRVTRGVLIGTAVGLAVLVVDLAAVNISAEVLEKAIGIAILAIPVIYFRRLFRAEDLDPVQRDRTKALVALFLASAAFWMIYDQSGSVLSIFAEQDSEHSVLGLSFPVSWFQSINPVFILALAPVMAWMWVALGSRQPGTAAKFSLGILLVGVSFLVMAAAASEAADGRVSALWLVAVYFIQTVGELSLSPIGLSVASKLAPPPSVSTTVGIWFLSISAGDVVGGMVAGLYDVIALPLYFGLLGVITIGVASVVFASRGPISRLMHGLS